MDVTQIFDAREQSQIKHAQEYAAHFSNAGVPGHGQFLLIAKLTDAVQSLVIQKNNAYTERDKTLVLVARLAQELGYKVGIGQHVGDEWDDEWRSILFIDLPSGQVSWHIHESETSWFYFVGAYDGTWDGHTTEEKYQRVLEPGL